MVFILRWLERGLGQILAPDQNYQPNPDEFDTKSNFWNIVAPDSNFNNGVNNDTVTSTPRHDQSTNKLSSPIGTLSNDINNMSLMSPSSKSTPSTSSSQQQQEHIIIENRDILLSPPPHFHHRSRETSDESSFLSPQMTSRMTPKTPSSTNNTLNYDMNDIEMQVLYTAKSLASCLVSPTITRKKIDFVFRLCSSTTSLNDINQKKLRTILQNDITLYNTRCSRLGNICPDGYTLLMACSFSNHVIAATILLDIGNIEQQLKETNLQGKTAYHIAAEYGNGDMIEYLQTKYNEINIPYHPQQLDLLGRTPLGVSITSPIPKAHSKSIQNLLYTSNDISIIGNEPIPIQQRISYNDTINVIYSVSQIPGRRVIMEDSLITSSICHNTYTLFAICDGHSDYGQISKFVTESLPSKYQNALKDYTNNNEVITENDWMNICTNICVSTDARLKDMNIPGGSTAIITIISKNQIIIANVGDCRCILIQQQNDNNNDVAELISEETVVEGFNNNDNSTTTSISTTTLPTPPTYHVIPLSYDHKADTDIEIQRIEKAGLHVIQETFHDECSRDNETKLTTISKIKLNDNSMMACSRSFGDFEYKANETLDVHEQAVIVIPDVIVRPRDYNNDLFIVLACDGIWDVMTNDDVQQFILNRTIGMMKNEDNNTTTTSTPLSLPTISDELIAECLNRGSTDNLSCIIISLNPKINEIMMNHMNNSIGVEDQNVSKSTSRKALDFTPQTK